VSADPEGSREDGGAMTRAEAEEARCLAEALDGRPGRDVDAESLAVARLLSAVGDASRDEVSARRLRRRLAREAAASASRLRPRLALAAAAAVLVGVVLTPRPGPAPTPSLLAAREASARAALAALAPSPDPSEARAAALATAAATCFSSARFDRLREAREIRLLGEAWGRTPPRSAADHPGGQS